MADCVYLVQGELHAEAKLDLCQRLDRESCRGLLPAPYLRGPGGGAHRTPKAFLTEYSFMARLWEAFRSFGQWVLRHDPFFVRGQRRAEVILVCNREAVEVIPSPLRHKGQWFLVNGISAEDLRILGGENGGKTAAQNPLTTRKTLRGGLSKPSTRASSRVSKGLRGPSGHLRNLRHATRM
jgi:hypothetical protein